MSTLDALESGQSTSQPLELYTFAIGGETFEYTTNERDVTVDGTVYQYVRGLERGSAKQSRDGRNQPLQVKLPADNAFVTKWKVKPPGLPGNVTIVRVQRAETPAVGTTQVLEFTGSVRSVSFANPKTAVVRVASLQQAANRPAPRYRFLKLCNHVLYGPGCGVDPVLHRVTAVVSAESTASITVPGVGAFADGTFTGGYVKPQGVADFRLIIDQVGDVLTIDLDFKDPVLGIQVDAFKGCDFQIDGDCENVFNNVIEFGGFPFVPTKNIHEVGLL